MDIVARVKDECIFHVMEEVIVYYCTSTEDIVPHSLDALVMDRATANEAPPSWTM